MLTAIIWSTIGFIIFVTVLSHLENNWVCLHNGVC